MQRPNIGTMMSFGILPKRLLAIPGRVAQRSNQKVALRRTHTGSQHRYRAVTQKEFPIVESTAYLNGPDDKAVLSKLSTVSLWRSLLINAVSSRPWLLLPALQLLMKLSAQDNMLLFSLERNPLLRAVTKHTFYKQFCAGETPSETQMTMKSFQEMGFKGTILTYAKETVFDDNTKEEHGLGVAVGVDEGAGWSENIAKWREGTVKTAQLLNKGDHLAIKTTGAGPSVCAALAENKPLPKQMCDAIHELSSICRERGACILIDAESQHYQWGIFHVGMALQRQYNRDGRAVIYNTYQAYLKSTQDTLARHMQTTLDENFTLGIKVVRGAYMRTELRELIHNTKEDTDDNYDAIAEGILRRNFQGFSDRPEKNGKLFPSAELLLASHNKKSLIGAHELHRQRREASLPTVPVKFGQLHGMSDAVSFALLKLKDHEGMSPEVYKCSTWGTLGECMAYLTRRGLENRDAASRTLDEYAALKAEASRRLCFWKRGSNID